MAKPCRGNPRLGEADHPAGKGEGWDSKRVIVPITSLRFNHKINDNEIPKAWRRSRMSSRPSTRLGHWKLTLTTDNNIGPGQLPNKRTSQRE